MKMISAIFVCLIVCSSCVRHDKKSNKIDENLQKNFELALNHLKQLREYTDKIASEIYKKEKS